MTEPVPRRKVWRHPKVISEHAFDKLRLLDCTLAEFEALLPDAGIIEEEPAGDDELKQLLLLVDWQEPLHVVVVVDDRHREERIVTVYEPDPNRWSPDYRVRRQ